MQSHATCFPPSLAASLLLLMIAGCPAEAGSDEGPEPSPEPPVLELELSPVKQFNFSWAAVDGADYYELFESANPGEPLEQIGGNIDDESISMTMPLHLRAGASYELRACNEMGCADSESVDVEGSLTEAVGYFQASNAEADDRFGEGLDISGDGNTLVVAAPGEDGGATGVDGDQADNSLESSGAVYVFVRDAMGIWTQQAYIKPSSGEEYVVFGSVALSEDGDTLVVGARFESTASISAAGAVYVFVRDGSGSWFQQAHIHATYHHIIYRFGESVALSSDGDTLAVGAPGDSLEATGINDTPTGWDQIDGSGAAYVFTRDDMGQWAQEAYVKASNTGLHDAFGGSVALGADGNTLAVGAPGEASSATGIDGDQADDAKPHAGAVYVFVRDSAHTWSQQSYIKASSTDVEDMFGNAVALSDDGNTLAVGAFWEDSGAFGIDGDWANNGVPDAGAVYVFTRDVMSKWSQQAYMKASNTVTLANFGVSVALSGDGNILAVGSSNESGITFGVGGDQTNEEGASGATYIFVRAESEQWTQRSYVKASSWTEDFGAQVALSTDGNTLAVGDGYRDGGIGGIGGDQSDVSRQDAGAVYIY